jgi:hypothetical protein
MNTQPTQSSASVPGALLSAVLKERGEQYGEFSDIAETTMSIKRVFTNAIYSSNVVLWDDQMEALHMIAHKIGRILNGDPNYADSWTDIAGYAQLVADRLTLAQSTEGK